MFLSQFGVKNYKCLGDIDIPLTPIHVLIGQNDSGKTSLMEAIAATYASLQQPIEAIFPQPWHGRQLVRFSGENLGIELRGRWDSPPPSDPIAYGLSLRFENAGEACSVDQRWLGPQGRGYGDPAGRFPLTPGLPVGLQPSEDPAHAHKPEDTKRVMQEQSGRFREQSLGMLADFLKPVEKYSLDPRAMKAPAALETERKFRLDRDGFGLATLLDDILSFDSSLFEKIKTEFCRHFQQFTSIRLSTEIGLSRKIGPSGSYAAVERPGKGIHLVCQGRDLPVQQASDGAVLFLGILALAHLPKPPPLLLIEEPENGIYPKRLKEVVQLLKQLVSRRNGDAFPQIVLTTHSPYVLSFFDPEEATLLSRSADSPDAPVRARPLREAPRIRERMSDDFYLGELWYNLDEEELFHG